MEIYRVFPLDSTNPPTGAVPTRDNSPSNVAFATRDSTSPVNSASVSVSAIATTFTASNAVLNGINPIPNQTTGKGPVTGQEARLDVTFNPPFNLPPDPCFLASQAQVNSGKFYRLSSPKPIVAPGTPFAPDLQSWIRNDPLDPDWLRIGTDLVSGVTPPTFYAAFSLDGLAGVAAPTPTPIVSEPPPVWLFGSGAPTASAVAARIGFHRLMRRHRRRM